jgi:hypothetical protein
MFNLLALSADDLGVDTEVTDNCCYSFLLGEEISIEYSSLY